MCWGDKESWESNLIVFVWVVCVSIILTSQIVQMVLWCIDQFCGLVDANKQIYEILNLIWFWTCGHIKLSVYIYIPLINFCRLSLDKTDHLIQNWMRHSREYLSSDLKSVIWFYLAEEKPRNKHTFNWSWKTKTFCRSEASEASIIHTGGLDSASFSAPFIEPPLWCHSGN